MMNPLKDFLRPKYVVGLQVKEGFIGAVQIYVGLKGPEIDKAVFIEVADPERVQEELKRLFHEEGFKKEMIVTSLPSSKALIREISLPISQPKKVEKVIKYQMEPYLPCPVEEVLVDFLHPGTDGGILTFGVEKKYLAEHLALLAGAGIEPDAVTLDDIALYSLFLYKHGGETEQPIAIVNQDGEKLVVQIIRKKMLEFIRILPDDADQLADTFRFYRMKRPDLSVEEIYFAGNGSSAAHEKAQALQSKTSIKTMVWRPFDEMRDRLDKTISLIQPKLGVPLGLAIGAVYPPEKSLDLRREEFVPKTYFNLRKMFLSMGVGLLLLAALLTVNVYQKAYYQERQYNRLQAQVRQVFTEAFPDATQRIVRGQEVAQLEQKIAEEMSQYQGLEEAAGREKILDVLLSLSRIISEDPDVQIENASVEGKDIRIDGRTASFEAVDRLTGRLTKAGLFKNIKLVGARMDKKDNAVTFNFAMERN
ncbi:MAG TPA: type II secretion system protein GspL [Desulfatiglandales bacterium]|nr:type II secretion system protein GspL [Desulfatiglandales bacterium]